MYNQGSEKNDTKMLKKEKLVTYNHALHIQYNRTLQYLVATSLEMGNIKVMQGCLIRQRVIDR